MMKLNIQLFASGNITFATSGALQGKIDWTSTSNGSTANTSTVTARIYARKTTSVTTTGRSWNGNVNIGGNNHTYSQIYTGVSTSIGTSWVLIETFTNTITHNDNGSKTITISGSVSGPSGTSLEGVTSSGSGSAVLDTIPRGSIFNFPPNMTYTIGDDIEVLITKYVDTYYDNFSIWFEYADGTVSSSINFGEIFNGDIVSFTPEQLDMIYSFYSNLKQGIIVFYLATYIYSGSDTIVGIDRIYRTCYITEANPTFTDFDYADTNATTTALTGDSSIIVSRYSNVKVDVPTGKKAVAIKGATMTNYNVNGNLRPYADPFTYTINGVNATELIVYAIDSRSNQTRVSKALNVKAYTDLVKLTQGATREDGIGSQVTFDITGTYWNNSFGSVTNNVTATYRYRITGTTTWTTGLTAITIVKSGANFSFNGVLRGDSSDNGFEIANGYEIEIIVSDKLTSKTFNCNISPSSPALEVYKNNVSLGGIYDEALDGRVQLLGKYVVSEENSHAKIEDTPINIINNLTTASAGLGMLDAYQGKVLNDKFTPVVLYNNSTGTNGTVTLSETFANFSFVDVVISFVNASGIKNIVRVYNTGTTVGFENSFHLKDDYMNVYYRRYSISGTSITVVAGQSYMWASSGYVGEYNNHFITKVIGYR